MEGLFAGIFYIFLAYLQYFLSDPDIKLGQNEQILINGKLFSQRKLQFMATGDKKIGQNSCRQKLKHFT